MPFTRRTGLIVPVIWTIYFLYASAERYFLTFQ